jgi:hypothetical protein
MVYAVVVTDDRRASSHQLADRFALTEEEVIGSPNFLVGTVEQMVDDLRRRREELRISYITLPEHFMELFAPVAERLVGT